MSKEVEEAIKKLEKVEPIELSKETIKKIGSTCKIEQVDRVDIVKKRLEDELHETKKQLEDEIDSGFNYYRSKYDKALNIMLLIFIIILIIIIIISFYLGLQLLGVI